MNWWVSLSQSVSPDIHILGSLLYWYGLLIGLGTITGIWLSERVLGTLKASFWIVIGFTALLGARLYHVLDKWDYYSVNPSQLLNLTQGGLAIFGAVLGGVVAIKVYSRVSKIDFFRLSDKVAFGLPIAQSIGRWGNFFNMEAFGPPTDLPWKIFISPSQRPPAYLSSQFFHPLFLYESLLNLLLFFVLLYFTHRRKPLLGFLTASYLIGYGLIRLVLEPLRLDTWVINNIKVASFLSILSIHSGIVISRRIKKHN